MSGGTGMRPGEADGRRGETDVPSGRQATVSTPPPGDERLARLSLNQKTLDRLTLPEAVDACVRHGIRSIGLWREPVNDYGVTDAGKLVRAAGLRVSSLCRGGFLTEPEPAAFRQAVHENQHAIEDAATLGTDTLVMVVGGLPPGSRDLPAARELVRDGIAELAPFAARCGVRLALEPMHPLFCADRGVLSTLSQALDLAEQFPPEQVGVMLDTYHLWWDPTVAQQIARAGRRIAGFQVCDWVVPLPADSLLGRGMMGDGHIDFRYFRRAVEAAGYDSDIEVELFNADVWSADPDDVLATLRRRYLTEVA